MQVEKREHGQAIVIEDADWLLPFDPNAPIATIEPIGGPFFFPKPLKFISFSMTVTKDGCTIEEVHDQG